MNPMLPKYLLSTRCDSILINKGDIQTIETQKEKQMKLNLKGIQLLVLFIAFAGSTYAAVTTQAALSPFTITGSIRGLPDGTQLNLVPGATHMDEKPVAEAKVSKGQFIFRGTVTEPRLFYIQVEGVAGQTSVMVEGAKITLSGVAVLSNNGGNKYYEFKNIVVKGSNVHLQYLKKRVPKDELDSLFMANQAANEAVLAQSNEANSKNDTVQLKLIRSSAAWKKMEADESAFFKLADERMHKVISDNKDSWWGPFFALDLFNYFTPNEKAMYAQFSQQAKDSYYGKILGEIINPVGFKGKPAPALDLKSDVNAAPVLASLIKGHKYVLIDFWASWCVPCRKSIPNLKKAYAEFKDRGLQVVSISIDKKEADWVKAQGEEKLPWPSFLDKGATANAWKIQAIPAMFLLDENGVVIAENLSLEEVITKIKAI